MTEYVKCPKCNKGILLPFSSRVYGYELTLTFAFYKCTECGYKFKGSD